MLNFTIRCTQKGLRPPLQGLNVPPFIATTVTKCIRFYLRVYDLFSALTELYIHIFINICACALVGGDFKQEEPLLLQAQLGAFSQTAPLFRCKEPFHKLVSSFTQSNHAFNGPHCLFNQAQECTGDKKMSQSQI